MCMEKTPWERAIDFHGHVCMGLAKGFRVAEAAMGALGGERDVDEQMVAVVENDSCAVDAIQVITGCTVGKGNLILRDYGKQAYTFALREKKKAVRITAKSWEGAKQEAVLSLRKKIAAGDTSEEEKARLKEMSEEMLRDYLSKPLDEICEIKEIPYDIPEKARLFSSVTCSCCGEKVMEPRARLQDGKAICIPCADNYNRGWGN
ncbi:MAG: FmdE family protein [Bacillota bacterium]|nr:FmdE family protein [Bacillota bacterium]